MTASAMALNMTCSPSAITAPEILGASILSLEANLVQHYNQTAISQLYYGHATTTADDVSFCNVTITYTHPGNDDKVHLQTWLPLKFNGRIQNVGGGGFVAGGYSPSLTAMTGAIAEGYATSTTDAGLPLAADLGPEEWALLSPGNPNYQLLNNLASISLNDQALMSKSLVRSFYGRDALEYSYWSGCSQGGRQGMMLAQRYPDAYDGIHACAPAIFWNQLFTSSFWPQLYMRLIDYFPQPCELDAVVDAAVDACDGLDGVVDGIISEPDACTFDPMSVVGETFTCTDNDNQTQTISPQGASIAKATWSGARSSPSNDFIWYGPNIGGQLSGSTTELTNDIGPAMTACTGHGRNSTCVGVPLGLGEVWIKYFLESRPDWSYENMTHDDFTRYAHESIQRYDSIIGTADPDLSAFFNKGGKILGYHGASDQIIPTKGTQLYLDLVRAQTTTTSSSSSSIDDSYRMFLVPGLLHCSGGPGGQPINTFDALRAWVENSTIPESLPHSYTITDEKTGVNRKFGRLLCPYPKKAVLKKGVMVTEREDEPTTEDYECVSR